MSMLRSTSISVAIALAVAVAAPAAASVMEVQSEAMRSDAPVAAPVAWRAASAASLAVPQVRLLPMAPERIEAVHRHNARTQQRRLQVGIERRLSSEAAEALPALDWQPVAGGSVAQLDVVAPGASGLRVGLRADRLPAGVELRVAGSDFSDDLYLVAAAEAGLQADGGGLYWTAATDGERQRLELFAPDGVDTAGVTLAVEAVSHLLVAPQGGEFMPKALGDSGACNIDVVCRANDLGGPFLQAKNAVARMLFQSGGGTFTCTGTLLNDLDDTTQTPWFFTANHCIGNQTEASTLSTFWNNEAQICNVDANGPNIQLASGAQLLYSQPNTDGALLRLNGTPPAAAAFAGWNANPLNPSTPVVAIHHPSGDIKKVSLGNHSGSSANVNIAGQVVGSAFRASWSEGTTEGGSSGSGLFTTSNGYQLRGGLFGGAASCANTGQSEANGNVDYYSRLDLIYPAIQQYIGAPAGNFGPTRDYTGQWDVASEGGRGLSLFQFGVGSPNNVLFGLWFIYDSQGRAAWYQIDPSWTGQDVASGRVVRWVGSPWGPTYDPGARSFVETGMFTLTFTSATAATLAYNVDGVNRTVTLRKLQ
jgi:lysyl endopeptidase